MIRRSPSLLCGLVGLLFVAVLHPCEGGEAPRPSQPGPYAVETNVLYRSADDALTPSASEKCRLDVYHPLGTNGFPTVVWFHGGGLTSGRRSIPEALRGKGIAVVGAGYRLSPQDPAPAYLRDAAAAVGWTFRNIARYGGSPRKIFVAGHSAGGYLTAMLGLDPRWLAAEGIAANSLAGLIPCSPQCITHFTIRAERGIRDTQPVIDDLAPLYHVRPDAPPMLLITGDRNRELLGRYEENAYLWRMMKVVGHTHTDLMELQGYGHGDMVEPSFPLLLNFIRARTPP